MRTVIGLMLAVLLCGSAVAEQRVWESLNGYPTRSSFVGSILQGLDGRLLAEDGNVYWTGDGGETWHPVGRSDAERRLTAGWFIGDSTVFASGDGGVYVSRDLGSRWTNLAESTERYSDICFVDENLGAAAGRYGLYKTTNGGQTWLDAASHSRFRRVFFTKDGYGYAASDELAVYFSSDSGRSWQSIGPVYEDYLVDFAEATVNDTDYVYAVGRYGDLLRAVAGGTEFDTIGNDSTPRITSLAGHAGTLWCADYGTVYRSLDGGASWVQLADSWVSITELALTEERALFAGEYGQILLMPDVSGETVIDIDTGTDESFSDMWFFDTQEGIIGGGSGGLYHTADGGRSLTLLHDFGRSVTSLFFTDRQNGWALVNGIWERGIYRTRDGGNTWAEQSPAANDLLDIEFFPDGTAWFGMETGHLAKSVDGGETWEPRLETGLTREIYQLYYANGTGWAATDEGIMAMDTGGHLTPKAIHDERVVVWSVRRMQMVDDSIGYAAGERRNIFTDGMILKTTDGGENWWPIAVDNVWMPPLTVFANQNEGWVGGETIMHTTDGGETWNTDLVPSGELTSFSKIVDGHIWAGGRHGQLYHYEDSTMVVGARNPEPQAPARSGRTPVVLRSGGDVILRLPPSHHSSTVAWRWFDGRGRLVNKGAVNGGCASSAHVLPVESCALGVYLLDIGWHGSSFSFRVMIR
jgi:photosystem II stability/assembly factor-like uncharacterized protein